MLKFIAPLFLLVTTIACNNNTSNTNTTKKEEVKTPADSLMHEVMEGHDAVMPKMSKVRTAQKKAQQMIDSIATLPAKAQNAVASLKSQLDSLVNELNYADFAMDKWMSEFNMDSAVNNAEERIKYLSEEKLKIGKVKESVLNSLAKADSLLKTKF